MKHGKWWYLELTKWVHVYNTRGDLNQQLGHFDSIRFIHISHYEYRIARVRSQIMPWTSKYISLWGWTSTLANGNSFFRNHPLSSRIYIYKYYSCICDSDVCLKLALHLYLIPEHQKHQLIFKANNGYIIDICISGDCIHVICLRQCRMLRMLSASSMEKGNIGSCIKLHHLSIWITYMYHQLAIHKHTICIRYLMWQLIKTKFFHNSWG